MKTQHWENVKTTKQGTIRKLKSLTSEDQEWFGKEKKGEVHSNE